MRKKVEEKGAILRLFVDTSAFLALEDKDDENYGSAAGFRENLRMGQTPFRLLYTTNYVFDEAITLIRRHLGHNAAVSFGEAIRFSKLIRVIWVSQELESRAWNILKKYRDKDYSYTDCTSFAVMDEEEIETAFAYDQHFIQYGVQCVP